MTPKRLKIEAVEKSDYRVYLKKATDFHDIMLKAFDSANWTAAGLNTVHCATLKRIVAKKNLIAYENRELRQAEALEITKMAERFYSWAKSNLPTR